jgi:hypothetical protein
MENKMTPEELERFIHRELRALPTRQAPAGFEARLQAAVKARAARPAPTPELLEELINRELRGLPSRRAPRTLESRVLAEIERRATIAWYHKSWSYWPAPVRAAFMAVGGVAAAAAVVGFSRLSQGPAAGAISQELANGLGWVSRLVAAGNWVVNFSHQLLTAIPPLWLYGGAAFIAAMYATFVGLGATAYRYLYRNN